MNLIPHLDYRDESFAGFKVLRIENADLPMDSCLSLPRR